MQVTLSQQATVTTPCAATTGSLRTPLLSAARAPALAVPTPAPTAASSGCRLGASDLEDGMGAMGYGMPVRGVGVQVLRDSACRYRLG
eukprot:2477499-Rhodomonas_salina.2